MGRLDHRMFCGKSRELVSLLRESEVPYRVVSTRTTGSRMLTPKQRLIFDSALNEGYWDTPTKDYAK